jgi:hypothetical protein
MPVEGRLGADLMAAARLNLQPEQAVSLGGCQGKNPRDGGPGKSGPVRGGLPRNMTGSRFAEGNSRFAGGNSSFA